MPSTPDPHSHSDRAASFSTGADVYARVRPTYPTEAVDWMVPRDADRVLDLAAGTGLLTGRLVSRGHDVVAVDASRPMLDELTATLPGVTTHVGTAEDIPLPDGSVDAVTVGQAWHWFDPPRAAAELARVLRPGGTLAVVWNDRDERIDWVGRFGEILHAGDALRPDNDQSAHPPSLGDAFDPIEAAEFRWLYRLATADLRTLAGTRSYLLTLPPEQREQLLQRVDDLVVTHPDLAGTTEVAMPYVTTAYRARRR
ncbi:class I SAM-dependent methyltransferase [Isoptericola halotolerans]|uniref:SAM-dependent methyltransferase n=1 Tax=Isoptericola halotolerans TaxID=300560 RepID=A0ABX2A9R6_9MICO|nr:class I SAM-dependent methyltransferase [Isoptericola halotolerans]NOV98855.1 SAM-dependent methyltransferase [Isoptericola halotolerans]